MSIDVVYEVFGTSGCYDRFEEVELRDWDYASFDYYDGLEQSVVDITKFLQELHVAIDPRETITDVFNNPNILFGRFCVNLKSGELRVLVATR
jgi:hypothetical protein